MFYNKMIKNVDRYVTIPNLGKCIILSTKYDMTVNFFPSPPPVASITEKNF